MIVLNKIYKLLLQLIDQKYNIQFLIFKLEIILAINNIDHIISLLEIFDVDSQEVLNDYFFLWMIF